MVILMSKGRAIHTTIKIQANSISRIHLRRAYNERVGGPLGANISDGPRGVTAPGSKALALIDYNSGSSGGGWRPFVGPRRMLEKIGRVLGVLKLSC